jgi:hypothetical protein
MASRYGGGGNSFSDGPSGEPEDQTVRQDEPASPPRPSGPGRSGRSDIAEFLSAGMMSALTVLILGLLGLIYVVSESAPTARTSDTSGTMEPSEAITATRINGADGDGTAAAPEDIDGDGDVGADERPDTADGTGADGATGPDVDGDGDTAGDRESPVDAAAADAPASPTGGADAAPAAGSTAPTGAETPSDVTASEAASEDTATERATDSAILPPGERAARLQPSDSQRPASPDGDDRTGLFSADDPGRQVATVPDTSPRDELVTHVDLDGDGTKERVWAAVVADRVLTRIERVVDGAWTPVSEHTGAVADRLIALRARDLTGDGRPEVHTRQWVGTEGESITLWSYADDALRRMSVTGGCADGSNTIGLVGALVRRPGTGQPGLVAVCRDPVLPPQQWPSGLYEWRDGTWTFLRYAGEMP